jgi:membrane-bound ClpP family serine protease
VVASLFVSALAVSGAVFLILEMYAPFVGLIHLSSAPLRAALAQLGH